jgi:hypothetical protein
MTLWQRKSISAKFGRFSDTVETLHQPLAILIIVKKLVKMVKAPSS